MSETLRVRRWSRLGADRLVVTGDTGAQVGWIDLLSGEVVMDRPVLEDSLRRAAQEYLRADVPELVLPGPRGPREAFDSFRADEIAAPGAPAADGGLDVSVGARLEQLVPEGWLVLNDVPVGRQGAGLDHLLIGPGGVYTIRAHLHPGSDVRLSRTSIEVDGRPTHYLRDARLEQGRVRQVLGAAAGVDLEVRAVIVLSAVTKVEAIRAAAGRRVTWTS